MRIIIFLSFLSSLTRGQVTPFDFIEASLKANEVQRTLAQFGRQKSYADRCETYHTSTGEAVASCSVRDEDYRSPILKIDYAANEIPAVIQYQLPEKFIQEIKNKKVSCVYRFKVSNDNQILLGRGLDKNENRNLYGDDFGRTHGLDVGVSCASEDGLSNAFVYTTELYSSPDRSSAKETREGNVSLRQKFTSENIFAVIQDNIKQGNVTYWKRGVGFINFSEKKKWGLLQSTGQQEWFHSIVNRISSGSAYDYTYQEGTKDQWGAFVTLAIGLQENRQLGDRCQLKLNADLGTRLSTLKDSTTFSSNAEAKFSYQVDQNASIYLRAQSETIVRSTGRITENTLAAGIETRKGSSAELGVMDQRGNRKDVADTQNILTGKNDLQVVLRIGYKY